MSNNFIPNNLCKITKSFLYFPLEKLELFKFTLKFVNLNTKTKIMAYKIDPNTCVACGTCIGECPSGAINEGDVYTINPDLCISCGACADACPMGSISADE